MAGMTAGFDRPLVSDEEYLPCRSDSNECVGQVTADGHCDIHRTHEGDSIMSNPTEGRTPAQKASLGRTVLVTVDRANNNGSDVAPATIVRAWSDELVNVKVHTDGPADLWFTSVPLHADREALDAAAVKWRDDMVAAGYDRATISSYSGAFWPPRV